jgi:hypothetical protein
MKMSNKKSLEDKIKAKFARSPHAVLMGDQEAAPTEAEGKSEASNKNESNSTALPNSSQEANAQHSQNNEPNESAAKAKGESIDGKPLASESSSSRENDERPERRTTRKKEKKGIGFKRRGDKFTDQHTQKTFYVNNHIHQAMELLLGWGEQTYFVNEAFKRLILSDEDCVTYLKEHEPQLLEAIKNIN